MFGIVIIIYFLGALIGGGMSAGAMEGTRKEPIFASFVLSWFTVGMWIGALISHLLDNNHITKKE
jgi:hypothetical protein